MRSVKNYAEDHERKPGGYLRGTHLEKLKLKGGEFF